MTRSLLHMSLLLAAAATACTGAIEGADRGPSAGRPVGSTPGGQAGNGGVPGAPGAPAGPGGSPIGGAPPVVPGGPDAPEVPRGTAEVACVGQSTTPPPPRRLRRLTPVEYANTVAVLLTGKRAPGPVVQPDPTGIAVPLELAGADYRFQTYAGTHGLTNFEFGRSVASSAELGTKLVAAVRTGTCWATAAAGTGADACIDTLVKERGAIMFRRPLASDEVMRYGGIAKMNATAFGRDEALATAFRAMLMAPQFLFLTELGEPLAGSPGRARLTPYEIASAISYTLTQRPPDEPLWAAATMGALSTREQISAQVLRILEGAASAKSGREFIAQYFELDRVLAVAKSIEKPCEYGRERIHADVELLIGNMFATNGRKDFLKTLLTTSTGYAGCDSYKLYGLPADPKSTAPVALPPAQRAGLLTHPAFLAGHASFEETLPVKRGRFVNESILCRAIPEVPIDVVAKLPAANSTMREKLAVHSKEVRCAACHTLLDPPGLALEQYDPYGRFRTSQFGKPIDASGMLTGTADADGMFKDAVDLSRKLGGSITVQQCFVRHTFRYYMGRTEDAFDSCSLDAAAKAYAGGSGDFHALVAALFTTPSFLDRSL